MRRKSVQRTGWYVLLGTVFLISILFAGRRHNRFLYRYSAILMQIAVPETVDRRLPSGTYASHRHEILRQRVRLRERYQRATTAQQREVVLKEAGAYLSAALTTELIPYWYGTKWSFEGHTEVPQQGSIACGYFVSTLLNHAGLNLNRYKMAQQAPLQEVLTLHQQTLPISFQAETAEDFRNAVRTSLQEGLYIFGMTNHVGFLWIHAQEVYLIHSGYIYPRSKVVIEKVIRSPLLYRPIECRLGAITTNPLLIRQWLLNASITVKEKVIASQ